MQLFTLGLNELNEDGSLKLDSNGNPIPTYSQDDVEALAGVFTGWTYPLAPGLLRRSTIRPIGSACRLWRATTTHARP